MDTHRAEFTGTLVRRLRVLGAAVAALAALGPAMSCTPLVHADSDLGGGCVITADNPAATLDALRFHCTPDQQATLYRDAPVGDVPAGATSGWVISPADMQWWAPLLWIGKTFRTGPDGGTLVNRLTPLGIEGWPGLIHRGASLRDRQPAWIIDYTPITAPQIVDEIREVAPGVWFGYSLRQDPGGAATLLSYALT
ncbi:hypothetical protein [Nocardia stercoris]|uniref:DUF3455 domain-containing protein n=1 Tax=Nocardia stercoris TaxID=2483361 RepID=A0A3M2LBQ9_9NOCA|nr:hypothetical protein [Nocardia stercoris]RMI34854.1 hypothetical protein EBN03_00250 [Nocardia stercoris]